MALGTLVVAIKRVLECSRCFYVLVSGLKTSNRYIISEEKRKIEDKHKGRKICSQRAFSLVLQDESTCSKLFQIVQVACHGCIDAWEPLIFFDPMQNVAVSSLMRCRGRGQPCANIYCRPWPCSIHFRKVFLCMRKDQLSACQVDPTCSYSTSCTFSGDSGDAGFRF